MSSFEESMGRIREYYSDIEKELLERFPGLDSNLPEERAELDDILAGGLGKSYPTLTVLGNKVLEPRKDLECFPNPTGSSGRYKRFTVTLFSEEFTCRCPVTGQPDFATIEVEYEPREWIVESKSFKLYLWSFRDEAAFHEKIINDMADYFMERVQPNWCNVTGIFNPRGGIAITVTAFREWLPSIEDLEAKDAFPP